MITSFDGEYAFLSNFFYEPFDCYGVVVPTAEHAYQAQKASHGEIATKRLILSATTPGHAKRLGRRVKLREGWDDIKVDVMRKIIAAKFRDGSVLSSMLAATGDEELVEGNTWGDTFWGCVRTPEKHGSWVGANHLGIILMEWRGR